MIELSEETFLDYCQKYYTNEHCIGIDEFLEDLKTLKYIKVLLRKHMSCKEINEMLLVNHFLSFFNVFEQYAATQIMFFKFEDYYWSSAKSVLDYLGVTPTSFTSSSREIIFTDDIVANTDLYNKLTKLNLKRNV